MKIQFPKYNPIVFRNGYAEWQDAQEYEVNAPYTPHLPNTSRLSFQCIIDRTPYTSAVTSTIQLYVNNRAFFQCEFQNADAGNYPYYYVNKVGDNRFVFTCSLAISLILQTIGSADELNLQLKIRETASLQWQTYNAVLDICNDGKLMHYNQSGNGEQLGGYPQYFPYGLDIALDANFLHSTINSENEIFQDYKGEHHLISALPYEYYTLQWYKPIDDAYLMHLHTILHCDEKYIDGKRYELVSGAVNVEQVPRFNSRFVSVDLQRIEGEYVQSGNTLIEYDKEGRNGVAVISASQPYILVANGYTFTENQDGTISFLTEKNLTNATKSTNVNIISKADGSVIGTITLTNEVWNKGVGFYKVEQTFIVV